MRGFWKSPTGGKNASERDPATLETAVLFQDGARDTEELSRRHFDCCFIGLRRFVARALEIQF